MQASQVPVFGVVTAACNCSACVSHCSTRTDHALVHDTGYTLMLVGHRRDLTAAVNAATWSPICSYQTLLAVPQQIVSNATGQGMLQGLQLVCTFPASHPLSQVASKLSQVFSIVVRGRGETLRQRDSDQERYSSVCRLRTLLRLRAEREVVPRSPWVLE